MEESKPKKTSKFSFENKSSDESGVITLNQNQIILIKNTKKGETKDFPNSSNGGK